MTLLFLRKSRWIVARRASRCRGVHTDCRSGRQGAVWLATLLVFLGLAISNEGDASSETCSVRLERLSYDDPGTDDEEWLALSVLNRGDALTFSECGIAGLSLLNADGRCSETHYFDLAALAIPPDDRFVVCARGSTIGQGWGCDLSSDSTAALDDGWLQNGPEILRLQRTDGSDAWSFVYGGGATCFAAVELPRDKGSIDVEGVEMDDVLARCDEQFVRLPVESAFPREAAACPTPSAAPSSGSQPDVDTEPAQPAGSTSSASNGTGLDERHTGANSEASTAVTSQAAGGAPPFDTGETPVFAAGHTLDAGVRFVSSAELVEAGTGGAADDLVNEPAKPPELPSVGCALRAPSESGAPRSSVAPALGFGAWLLWIAVRRRPARRARLRARCAEHCARSFGRSP